ncbi:hypothetical protein F9278_36515 [Streptomyces phaeolivaceus]|uniref:Uncharacterized protein n=1 Tax=Streptomyces phaeolivaceus TaxID=2653200 RepID=A0A5P8KCN2_9ACTN|nr:hypothetical protein [Streptomyces phaeolivaceus]QFR00781.1 hypothetical protein F9278_36515 [Streptomyces phaeolivaceus]
MPHTPTPGDRRDGEFADLFARKTRTPLRGFLPGRRVWNAVGGSAAAVLVIAGSATAVAAIDWDSGSAGKVTTAAEEPTRRNSSPGDAEKASAAPSPREGTKDEDDPDVVYVPVSGGSGAGTAAGGAADSAPDAETKSDTDGTTGGGSGSTGSSGSTGTEEKSTTTTKNTESQTTSGYLWADGSVETDSNDFWDQSTITVKSTKPLTSLKVVVRVIQTGGVSSTGAWTSLGDKAAVGQNSTADQIGYVITLKSGVTLAPGTYVFKVQYNHAEGGRDAGRDLYTVTAVASDSDDEFLSGRF